ncbi:putative orfan [Tupanvirus soda lake]|uniref:Orfan n=2 Tax=Tupanvirus TaxID=2094720 RepID=A0AC62AD81_9VIRU|nr:putative orfan [Tupanvirus soda lake]QKU35755.1 putative orfan [Tupanvirus soda lake]
MSWLVDSLFNANGKSLPRPCCTHQINEVALICACCTTADPQCKQIPDSIDYSENTFLIPCLRCNKQLHVVISVWGETASYTEFIWDCIEVEPEETSSAIKVVDQYYPKTLVRDAKQVLHEIGGKFY